MLSVEGPLDFVKDATVVFFIIKLDDINKSVILSENYAWDPTSEDDSYDLRTIQDEGYWIEGRRSILGFPTVQDIMEAVREKCRMTAPSQCT